MNRDQPLQESSLGSGGGSVRLKDTACAHPCSASPVEWEVFERSWRTVGGLSCRAASAEELEAARARRPAPPPRLRLGGVPMPCPGALGIFIGDYALQEGHVNGCPAWKQLTDKCIWIARGRNGCWMGQNTDVLGTEVRPSLPLLPLLPLLVTTCPVPS